VGASSLAPRRCRTPRRTRRPRAPLVLCPAVATSGGLRSGLLRRLGVLRRLGLLCFRRALFLGLSARESASYERLIDVARGPGHHGLVDELGLAVIAHLE